MHAEPHEIHGNEAQETHHDEHHDEHHGHGGLPHESPWVVTVPLILLAIPSIFIGFFTIGPMLFGGFFTGAIEVLPQNDVIKALGEEFHGPVAFALHGMQMPAFWLALAGFALATYIYLFNIKVAERAQKLFALPIRILENKYGFDDLWIKGFAGGGIALGRKAWTVHRCRPDRRRDGQRHRQSGRSHLADDPRHADRPPVHLCVCDDSRPDRC